MRLRLVIIIVAVALLAGLLAAATIPGAWKPGTAETVLNGTEVGLDFETGDRYFWFNHNIESPPSVDAFLDEIPGDQILIKRSSYDDVNRQAYDEAAGHGDTFLVEPGYLYEMSGTQSATVTFQAAPGEVSQSFGDAVKDRANKGTKQVWLVLVNMPGAIWDDLKSISSDMKNLAEGSDGDSKTILGLGVEHIPLLAGAAVLILLAPMLGVDNLILGAFLGLFFTVAGQWPLGIAAALLGWLMDNNRAPGRSNLPGILADAYEDSIDTARERYPKLLYGGILYAAGIAAGLLLKRYGLPRAGLLVLMISAAAAIFLIFEAGRTPAFKLRYGKLGPVNSWGVMVMAWVTAVIVGVLFKQPGLAWILAIFGIGVAAMWLQYWLHVKPHNEALRLGELQGETRRAERSLWQTLGAQGKYLGGKAGAAGLAGASYAAGKIDGHYWSFGRRKATAFAHAADIQEKIVLQHAVASKRWNNIPVKLGAFLAAFASLVALNAAIGHAWLPMLAYLAITILILTAILYHTFAPLEDSQ